MLRKSRIIHRLECHLYFLSYRSVKCLYLQTVENPEMLATLQKKEAQEKVLTEKWAEKWRETQKILQEQKALGLRKAGAGVVLDSDMPHLIGIDDNLLSTGVTLYHLKVITDSKNNKRNCILCILLEV